MITCSFNVFITVSYLSMLYDHVMLIYLVILLIKMLKSHSKSAVINCDTYAYIVFFHLKSYDIDESSIHLFRCYTSETFQDLIDQY